MDRNVNADCERIAVEKSLSARRAWIEMLYCWCRTRCRVVALRKESVDRNATLGAKKYCYRVALRKESVDRNIMSVQAGGDQAKSLSARRAWIEIE